MYKEAVGTAMAPNADMLHQNHPPRPGNLGRSNNTAKQSKDGPGFKPGALPYTKITSHGMWDGTMSRDGEWR